MSRKSIFDMCKLCHQKTKMSFEHTPQQSAFNDQKIHEVSFERWVDQENLDDLASIKGKVYQRGLGDYCLCEKCNNKMGSWYGNDYKDWVQWVANHIVNGSIPSSIELRPLHVLKQIACNFICINEPDTQRNWTGLRQFVLNRDSTMLPNDFRFFIAGTSSERIRKSGLCKLINQSGTSVFSEILFNPLVLVLTMGTTAPSPKLVEITNFKNYQYDKKSKFRIRLPVLSGYTGYPGDYRSRCEVLSEEASRIT